MVGNGVAALFRSGLPRLIFHYYYFCTAGQYGTGSCANCPAGTWSAAGAATCTACGAGQYSGAGATGCSACAGTRSKQSTALRKLECTGIFVCTNTRCRRLAAAAGQYGTGSCANCPVGTFSGARAGTCTACASGTYSTSPGQATACPACIGTCPVDTALYVRVPCRLPFRVEAAQHRAASPMSCRVPKSVCDV